jgi:glucose/arabinose dehydrogenase
MKKYIISGLILLFSISLAIILNIVPSCGFLPSILPGFKGSEEGIKSIKLPDRFHIDVFAKNLPGAHSLALGPDGIVFVGTRNDRVYALFDKNRDNKSDEVLTIATGLNSPNGVAYRDGSLYVAEISRVLKFPDIVKNMRNKPRYEVVNSSFPTDEHHGWKFIAFGPDGKLYVPVGAPCNVCFRQDDRFASIMRMNADGSGLELFASGIRNTVGFDWQPETKELWFTDNGRDMLGDNIPPDELNHAAKPGLHFGFPFCHARGIKDPEFGKGKNCSDYTAPELELGPHVAALGMRFYSGSMFPEKYRKGIFIAEHGSWNRSSPIGYRVMFVSMKGNKPASYEVFAEGWLKGYSAWGRPVDVLVMPDGSLLVSDDKADAVYRMSYK